MIDDQHGGTPTDNPRYEIPLTSADFSKMFQYGWEFDFRFKPIEGGNFVAWGINPSTVTDPGWGLATRERVGFGVSIAAADNSVVISPIGGTAVNLGADSANSYHVVNVVGAAGSSSFDISVDGSLAQTLDIKDGTSNSGSDNRTFWESGSSGGVGRSAAWNLVSLTVPEPGTFVVCSLALVGLALIRKRR